MDGKSMRTYNRIKSQFEWEPYIYLVKNRKYRHALAKMRTSSLLAIERGWCTRPVNPADLRICTVCNVVEDEEHLLLHCVKYAEERNVLFSKIVIAFPDFNNLSSNDKLVFLNSLQDPYIVMLVENCLQLIPAKKWTCLIFATSTIFHQVLHVFMRKMRATLFRRYSECSLNIVVLISLGDGGGFRLYTILNNS